MGLSPIAQAGLFQKKEVREPAGMPESRARDEHYRKMFAQNDLMNIAWSYQDRLELTKAMDIAVKAQGGDYISKDEDRSGPIFFEATTAVYKGDYDRALRCFQELHKIANLNVPHVDGWLAYQKKTEALIEWQKTGNKQPVYDWIEMMKKKNAQWLPPQKIVFHSTGIMIQFVQLYDLLGDYDTAIDYIQPFLRRHQSVKDNDHNINEHLGLIQALDESKQGLPKICIEDGKVCLGRATAYIIRSKFF